MYATYNFALIIAATLSGLAALLHIAIIFGGPTWYRFFGAGEKFASASAAGSLYPGFVTAGIASVLAVWAAYALSGAGVIPRLPILQLGLCIITAAYLLRGLAVVPLLVFFRNKATPFIVWSSLICVIYGAVHLYGLVQIWPAL
jgi:hypothetical protein